MTHTKGPWSYYDETPEFTDGKCVGLRYAIVAPNESSFEGNYYIARTTDGAAQAKANAALIAAAPDLLSVCEALLDNIDKGFSVITFTGNDGLTNKGDTGNLESMRAVVNKARGIK